MTLNIPITVIPHTVYEKVIKSKLTGRVDNSCKGYPEIICSLKTPVGYTFQVLNIRIF